MTGKILLLTKSTVWCRHAADLARSFFGDRVIWCAGAVGDPRPSIDTVGSDAVLMSFLSPWIIPGDVLGRFQLAINFHPGSRYYPGIGSYNFAIYEGAKEFGSVCHHMIGKVDAGDIVREDLFPLLGQETVEQLKLRTMTVMLQQFHAVLQDLHRTQSVPKAGVSWARSAFTRAELNALAKLDAAMSGDEIRLRQRAMAYPGFPGAYLELAGNRLETAAPPATVLERIE
jgi:methionyl-tRNA formyltransferase